MLNLVPSDEAEKLDQGEARLVIAQLAQHSILLGSVALVTNQLHSCLRSAARLPRVRSVALRPTLASGLPLASEGIWPSVRPGYRHRGSELLRPVDGRPRGRTHPWADRRSSGRGLAPR